MKLKICDDDDPSAEFETTDELDPITLREIHNSDRIRGVVGLRKCFKPEPSNAEIARKIAPDRVMTLSGDVIWDPLHGFVKFLDAVDQKIAKALEGKK